MARPNFDIQGVPPKMKCKAADGDCDMREINAKRNATTGIRITTRWRCIRKGCGQYKDIKF